MYQIFLKFYLTFNSSKYIFALFWCNQFQKFVEKLFESGLIVFWVVYFELRIAPLFTYCCSFPNKSPGDHKWTANLKLIRYSNLSKTKHFSQSFKNIESTTLITKEEKIQCQILFQTFDIFIANKKYKTSKHSRLFFYTHCTMGYKCFDSCGDTKYANCSR